jgi:hypothetical protein
MGRRSANVLNVFGDLTLKLPYTLNNPRIVLSDKTQIAIEKLYYFVDQDHKKIYTPFSASVIDRVLSSRKISGYAMCITNLYVLFDLPPNINIKGNNESGVSITINGVNINRTHSSLPTEYFTFSAIKIT